MSVETVEQTDLLAKYVLSGVDLGSAVEIPPTPPQMLEFLRPSGDRWSIAYHQLVWVEHREEVPATAKGVITLHFREHTVKIEGMRLLPLLKALQQYRPALIRVSDRAAAFADKTSPIIDKIDMPKRPAS